MKTHRTLSAEEESAARPEAATKAGGAVGRQDGRDALLDEVEINRTLTQLSQALLASVSLEEIAAQVLAIARQFTGSRHGYAGYIDPETGNLVSPTLTRDIWESCQVPDKNIRFSHFGGLWGWVLKNRKPLLANTPTEHPHSTGIPAGHIPIANFLSVPAMLDGELVGQIALANAVRDYTESDLFTLQRLATFFSLAIQRKRQEDRIRENSLFNRCVLASLPTSIAIVDEKGTILKTNKEWNAFARQNGADLNAAGKAANYLDVCRQAQLRGDSSAGMAAAGILEVIRGRKEIFQMEYPCHSPDERRWFLLQVTPFVGHRGGAVISHTNITDRKLAEMRLKESEYRYRTLFNSVNDAVFIHEFEGNFLEVNQEACDRLGYSREALLAMSPRQVDAPAFEHQVEQRVRELLQHRKVFFESVHLTREGRPIPVEINSRIIDYNGSPAVLSVARDISERKQAEKKLKEANDALEKRVAERTAQLAAANEELRQEIASRRSIETTLRVANEKMQGVLSTLGAGLLIVDQAFTIEYQNEIHRHWSGDRVGQSFAGYCQVASFGELKARCLENSLSGGDNTCELEYGYGGLEFEQCFSLFRDIDGEEKLIVLQRNVSEKKRLQAEAVRASRLASVGELAAGVAHEINNPINGVINYAQILMDELEEAGELMAIPGRILKEAERVASIVRNLLSFAREDRDEVAPAHLPGILDDALELVGKQFFKDGIRLETGWDADLPAAVVSSQKIQQVFVNLLSNARHALNSRFPGFDPEKALEVRMHLWEKEGRQWIRSEFTDHGTGMPPEVIARVCDPFFSTKPKGEGTGLGLSISYGIIKDLGGELSFESEVGRFTRVVVDLPAEQQGGPG